ncbi:MAG: hypothetical protein U0894_01075 [Pirellulales bacterium]
MTVMDTLSKINSFVRTLLATLAFGVIGAAAYFGLQTYNAKEIADKALAQAKADLDAANATIEEKQTQIVTQGKEILKLNADIDRLQTAMRLLKVDRRLARLTVTDQAEDPVTKQVFTTVDFEELSPQGEPIGPKRSFKVKGEVLYVDNWIVKFDDKYVEQADLDRSTSLCLFRRIFGEQQQPIEGTSLDEVGMRPQAYGRGGQLSEFEKKIWSDFWTIANDPDHAKSLGIRAANGEAVSMKVQKGKAYKLELRASGGLSIVPE